MNKSSKGKPWILLGELLNKGKVPVSKIAFAITKFGIQTHDRHGIRIFATDGSIEDKTSRAYVLELLAEYFKIKELPQPTYEQLGYLAFSNEWDSPLNRFGWPADELPDFKNINADFVARENSHNVPAAKSLLSGGHSNNIDWRERAREIADEIFDKDTSIGTRRTLKLYAQKVMEVMQERNIHGPRGRIVNPNTIMRDALQGGKWWAKKSK